MFNWIRKIIFASEKPIDATFLCGKRIRIYDEFDNEIPVRTDTEITIAHNGLSYFRRIKNYSPDSVLTNMKVYLKKDGWQRI